MRVLVTGAGSELGREVIRQLVGHGHQVTGMCGRQSETAGTVPGDVPLLKADPADAAEIESTIRLAEAEVVLNIAPQRSNTLLHDGHEWRGLDKKLPVQTAALLQAANACGTQFLLHASYAFLYGSVKDDGDDWAKEDMPLPQPQDRLAAAGISAEDMVRENQQFPVCTMRIGYLYGPQSNDLALYERSFKRHRSYYAGPQENRANFVHFTDAARAIVLACEKQPAGAIINIVDGAAVSFGAFIDYFAAALGKKKPRRIPTWAVRFLPFQITPQQVRQLELRTAQAGNCRARQLLDWVPEYPNCREGLAQTVRVWNE